MKMSGMLPAASENWKEMSLSVPPHHEPFFQPRDSINLAGFWPKAGREQGATLIAKRARGKAEKGNCKKSGIASNKQLGPYF